MAMWNFPDHPDITACERTGYPSWYDDYFYEDEEDESEEDEDENY